MVLRRGNRLFSRFGGRPATAARTVRPFSLSKKSRSTGGSVAHTLCPLHRRPLPPARMAQNHQCFVWSGHKHHGAPRCQRDQATWDLVTDRYSVRNNLVLQFKRDTIDQSPQLAETLFNRFGRDGELEFSRQAYTTQQCLRYIRVCVRKGSGRADTCPLETNFRRAEGRMSVCAERLRLYTNTAVYSNRLLFSRVFGAWRTEGAKREYSQGTTDSGVPDM